MITSFFIQLSESSFPLGRLGWAFGVESWQWILIICSSLILFFMSPLAKTTDQFFKAVNKKKAPNTLVLTGSL
ncbi:MAG: hypothetical protein ACKVIG_14025, partial [Flavobacteriales bacterium]